MDINKSNNEIETIQARIHQNEVSLEKLAYELRQLLHIQLGEDYLLLAEATVSLNDVASLTSALELSRNHLIPGFRYKNVSPSERHPTGRIKVRDKYMNLERGLRLLMISILLNDEAIIDESARLIWDPPFAEYIGPDGLCTYEEHMLAHAYRDYILNDINQDETVRNLDKLDKLVNQNSHLSIYAEVLKSLHSNDQLESTDHLETLIRIANDSGFNVIALGTLSLLAKKYNIDKSQYQSLKLNHLIASN